MAAVKADCLFLLALRRRGRFRLTGGKGKGGKGRKNDAHGGAVSGWQALRNAAVGPRCEKR